MIYLAIVTGLATAASAAFLGAYWRMADMRDPVAVNAWLGGVAACLLSLASLLYVIGHYGDGDYTAAFLTACAGFTVVAGVWAHRVALVLTRGEECTVPILRKLLNRRPRRE